MPGLHEWCRKGCFRNAAWLCSVKPTGPCCMSWPQGTRGRAHKARCIAQTDTGNRRTRARLRRGSQRQHLAGGLLEAVLGLGVLELDGADAAQVVQVAAQLLRAARHLRPLRLAAQLLRLPNTAYHHLHERKNCPHVICRCYAVTSVCKAGTARLTSSSSLLTVSKASGVVRQECHTWSYRL